MENYRKYIGWAVLSIVLLFGGCSSLTCYNSMVTMEEIVTSKWAQVENVYQRRSDVIPNLVSTVQGEADFERHTLNDIVQARASATQVKIDPTNITKESLGQFDAAQNQLGSSLSRLLVTVEKYPDLKSNESFKQLMSQIEGNENRIAVERREYNNSVQGFNQFIRRFPKNIWAGLFDFDKKVYFESDKGSNKSPVVKFK